MFRGYGSAGRGGFVKEALNLRDDVGAMDIGGGQRAATSALIQALTAAREGAPQLCIASELRKARPASEGELTQGDAAAAFLVGTGAPIARFLGAENTTVDFVDHFRAAGEAFAYTWESRWTDLITQCVRRSGVAGTLERGWADSNYQRFLFHRGLLDLDRGMRAEIDQKQPGSALYRNRKTVLGLIGGRCTRTGTVQFPKSELSVNANDHADGTQEDYPLAERKARIVTFTADSLTYSPNPPTYYGMIDFEGGGRMIAEFADVDADDVAVGREMEMVFASRPSTNSVNSHAISGKRQTMSLRAPMQGSVFRSCGSDWSPTGD